MLVKQGPSFAKQEFAHWLIKSFMSAPVLFRVIIAAHVVVVVRVIAGTCSVSIAHQSFMFGVVAKYC